MTQPVSDLPEIIFTTEHTIAERTPARRETVLGALLLSKPNPNTRAAYRADLQEYFAWFDEWQHQLGPDVFAVNRIAIDGYRDELNRRHKPASVARKLSALNQFYRYALLELEIIARNPVERVQRPKAPTRSTTECLELDDTARLRIAARTDSPLAHALISLLSTTGMRISEALNASTSDLGHEHGQCTIRIVRKRGDVDRLPLDNETVTALRTYLAGRRGVIFLGERDGRQLKRQQADRVIKRVADAAGVTKVSPHGLRHSAITTACASGEPMYKVQRMAGHALSSTTDRYNRARLDITDSSVHVVAAALAAAEQRVAEQG